MSLINFNVFILATMGGLSSDSFLSLLSNPIFLILYPQCLANAVESTRSS